MPLVFADIEDDISSTKPVILLYGEAGVGKTTLLASLEGKILIASVEKGLRSLRNYFQINPEEKERFLVVQVNTLDDLRELYQQLNKGELKGQFNWLALDSVTKISEKILKKYEGDGDDAYGAAYKSMEDDIVAAVEAFRLLSHETGLGVLMIAHEQVTKIEISKDLKGKAVTIDKFSPAFPGNKLGAKMTHIPCEIWRLITEEDETGIRRKIITAANSRSKAKSRGGLEPIVDVTDGFGDVMKTIGF